MSFLLPSRTIRWLLMAGCLFTQTGCVVLVYALYDTHTPTRDVSANRECWGGYEIGSLYRLKVDVFIANVRFYSNGIALATGTEFKRSGQWGGPTTTQEYKSAPQNWPDMMGVVDAGTLLRVAKIKHRRYLMGDDGDCYYVFASIVNGLWKGKTVEITELSDYVKPDGHFLEPSPQLLEKVATSQQNGARDRVDNG